MIRAVSLGFEIAVAVFLGAAAGYWLDSQFNSGPWCMVVGLIIGSTAGIWNAYKLNEHT